MLYWAMVFLLVAFVSALFGFGGFSTAAVGISKTLFYVAIVVFAVTLVMGMANRGRTRIP